MVRDHERVDGLCHSRGEGVSHTPGPWEVYDAREMADEFWIRVKHPDGWDVSLAAVRPGCDEADDLGDNEANARLIAQAPKMLAALQELVRDDGNAILGMKLAVEAIEAATGEYPAIGASCVTSAAPKDEQNPSDKGQDQ